MEQNFSFKKTQQAAKKNVAMENYLIQKLAI